MSTSRLVRIHKNTTISQRFSLLSVPLLSTRLYYSTKLLVCVRDYCFSYMVHQDLLLRSARYFQNFRATRHCSFSPPDISRIFVPDTDATVHQTLLHYCITVLPHFLTLLMYYCHLVISIVVLSHDFTSV